MKPEKEALVVVDYLNGFIPKAASGVNELPVEGGEKLAPIINELMRETKTKGGIIIGTLDWHPQGHMSFASNYINREVFDSIGWEDAMNGIPNKLELSPTADFTERDLQIEFGATGNQILWPDHCVANTQGAKYYKELDTDLIDRHIIKGYDAKTEMYSGFSGKEQRNDDKIIRLTDILKDAGVGLIKVVGLATDFCVNATAMDALKNGFDVEVIKRAIAGVDPDQSIKKLEELREAGAVIID